MRRATQQLLGGVAALVVVGAAVGGCAGSNDDSDAGAVTTAGAGLQTGADGDSAGTVLAEEGAREPSDDGAGEATATTAAPPDANGVEPIGRLPAGRFIALTGDLLVEVDDVELAAQQAVVAVEGVGGFVFGEDTSLEAEARSSITFKVPPERYREATRRLAALGTVLNQRSSAEDVTEAIVDLGARIEAAEVSVDRVRGYLSEAAKLDDLTRLEQELLARETQLAELRAQDRSLKGRVSLATLTVILTAKPVTAKTTSVADGEKEDEELPGFLTGLSGGWRAFVAAATVASAVVGALLPFLPFALIAGLIWWRIRRRGQPSGAPAATVAAEPAERTEPAGVS